MSQHAPATQRAASTARLVDMIAALEGFTGEADGGDWLVTRPYSGPKGRRQVVIGQSRDGTVGTTGIAADHAPTDDEWSVPCVILLTGEGGETPEDCEAGVEAAFNAVADMLAHRPRLNLGGAPDLPGVYGARCGAPSIECAWSPGDPPVATCAFDISLACSIWRNPR